jgi:uncharacterized heparinase superfamily protein
VSDAGGKDDGGRDGGQRLTRGRGAARTLGARLSEKLARIGYATPLHNRKLRGRPPLKLLAVTADPIAGDIAAGREIAAGKLSFAGHTEAIRTLNFATTRAPLAWREWVHGFEWLRDLAAASDRKKGAIVAELVVEAWLASYREYDELAWRADLAGRRLMFWPLYAPYILSRSEPIYRSLVLNHLARAARHVDRACEKTPEGMPRVEAAAGLLAAGLILPEGAARTVRAENALRKALEDVLLPGGGVASRRPADAVALLERLLTLRAFYEARKTEVSEVVAEAVETLASGIKGLTLGDGRLAAIHGGNVCAPERIAKALALVGGNVRPTRNGAASGFQRMDVGSGAHAGTLAFEMSDGDARMIVNCGGGDGAAAPLPDALGGLLRTTAAHSTLVVNDTNSTRLLGAGGLGKGVGEVVVTRHESEEGCWLDATHDGYAKRFGVLHRRRIFLSADGRDIRGEDALEPARVTRLLGRRKALPFDVRFHLAPGVEATPTADGKGALVKLAGRVWQMKVRGGHLTVDESIFVDESGKHRSVAQIVVSGETESGGATVNWSFKRASK